MLNDKDTEFIKTHAETMTQRELAQALGKSTGLVSAKIKELGLKYGRYSKVFDRNMDEYLKENYMSMADSAIAKVLGISTINVTSRRRILGLSKKSA